jgi:hypothetical protein
MHCVAGLKIQLRAAFPAMRESDFCRKGDFSDGAKGARNAPLRQMLTDNMTNAGGVEKSRRVCV